MSLQLLSILLFSIICNVKAQLHYQPEQIHLSFGASEGEYVLTWVTLTSTNQSTAIYGTNMPLDKKQDGIEETFIDGGSQKRQIFIHRVYLSSLNPDTLYLYIVGSALGWSERFYFKTVPSGYDYPIRIALFGDMGNENGKSIPYLQMEAENAQVDFFLHVGDFAYDMDTNNAQIGDEFMRQIQPISTIMPYMTCPGNHEQAYNFSNYRRRFSMPGGDGEGQFYSFNVGRAHIIAYSSEFYYYTHYGWKQIENQYRWLEDDLKKANTPEERSKHPWIIVMAHRPMYCSNNDDSEHCTTVDNYARVGIPFDSLKYGKVYLFNPEELFFKYGVDLMFWAHEHSYERFWPVYDRKVCNGTSSSENVYVDPPAPVHFVTGSAGCREGVDPFIPGGQPWSAYRSDDYGYTKMNIVNSTHLFIDQISVDQGGKVIDSMTYIRNKHGADIFNC